MKKKDISNRISINKQLIEPLLERGSKYRYDLTGMVDYVLRLYLADEIQPSRNSEDAANNSDLDDLNDFDIDLAA